MKKQHARTQSQFVVTLVPLEYVDETVPAGTVCEKLVVSEQDKSSMTRDMHGAGDGQQLIRVSGRVRVAPQNLLRPARASEHPTRAAERSAKGRRRR